MEHVGSIISLIGFFLASVVAGIVFAKRTGPIGNSLRKVKEWIVGKANKDPDSRFWQKLRGPDAVTFMTLVAGTFLVFVGQLLLLVVNWYFLVFLVTFQTQTIVWFPQRCLQTGRTAKQSGVLLCLRRSQILRQKLPNKPLDFTDLVSGIIS